MLTISLSKYGPEGIESPTILQNITLVPYMDDIMFIGSNEQEVASMLEALLRHTSQTVGNKPSRDSRPHHISKNSGSMASGMRGYTLQSEKQINVSYTSHQ